MLGPGRGVVVLTDVSCFASTTTQAAKQNKKTRIAVVNEFPVDGRDHVI